LHYNTLCNTILNIHANNPQTKSIPPPWQCGDSGHPFKI
jgi:hypothetical protein